MKKIVLRVLFTLALIVSVGGCAAWGYYDAVLSFFKESNPSIANTTNDDLVSDKEIINILVVGSDRRSNETANERSDSTMIATLDMKTKSVKVTSLMRDMYIDIPGHGMDKFNSSYAYGGVELLADTISTNFDIKLDGYVIVDFSSFRKVIDKIGGVEVTVSKDDAAYLNNTGPVDSGFILKKKYRTVKVGKQTLNGAQALAYSRIRKVTHPTYGDGDFGRCMRQQEVIQSILKKVKKQSVTEVISLATSMMSDVSTDLDSSTVKRLVNTVMKLNVKEIQSLRLPYEGTYKMGRRNGMFVFLINLEANKAKLQNFIYDIGDDDADYSADFGNIKEDADDGSSNSKSYQEDREIYTSPSTYSTRARSTTESTRSQSTQSNKTTSTKKPATTSAPKTTAEPKTTAQPKPTTAAPKPTEKPTEKPADTPKPEPDAENDQ